MSHYQAIALDMDGTLLTRDHKISSATRAALAQARAHGIKVLLVTGRHFMTARPFHHELALDTPLICSNGAYLYDPAQGRILAGDPLAVAPLTALLAEVQAQQMGGPVPPGRGHRLSRLRGACAGGCGAGRRTSRITSRSPCCRRRISTAGCKSPSGSWSCSIRIPAGCTASWGRWCRSLPFTQDWAAPYAVELVQPGCSKGNRLAQWAARGKA